MSEFLNTLKAGDVLNIEGNNFSKASLWDKISQGFATDVIIAEQKQVFSKKSRYKDHHTMIYFDPEHIFSVHPPKPAWLNVKEFDEGDCRIMSIYRWQKGRPLNDNDTNIMYKAAEEIISWNAPYDVGQLVDFMVSNLIGYPPYEEKMTWFDQGKKKLVCSVGAAAVFEKRRKVIWDTTGEDVNQPFRKINNGAFKPLFVWKWYHKGKGYWDINRTYPSMFANTETHFDNEFAYMGHFQGGKKISYNGYN